jgi:hypothetical protein
MPARDSEAIVLRTYPYGEADLVASVFTRDQGKIRGVARGVRRPKSRFGSGLERLAHVRLFYFFKETRDLARFDRCDLIGPPVFLRADYPTIAALDFIAEVSDQLLPEHEANDAYFRLLLLMVEELWEGATGKLGPPPNENGRGTARAAAQPVQGGGQPEAAKGARAEVAGLEVPGWLWRALTYFSLWAVRLGGWLPPLDACLQSGVVIEPEQTAYFERSQPGLFTAEFRTRDSGIGTGARRKTYGAS